MEDDLNFFQMEDDLNISANLTWPQYFFNWKKTLIFWPMEDDINLFLNGRQHYFLKIKDNLDILAIRRSHFFKKEDELIS